MLPYPWKVIGDALIKIQFQYIKGHPEIKTFGFGMLLLVKKQF